MHAPEAGLLLRQRAAREDGLKIQPLPLDRVHVVQSIGQVGHEGLPHAGLLLERREKRRRRQRGHQVLVVCNLREQVFPVLDERHRAAPRAVDGVLDGGEPPVQTPNLELVERLAKRNLSLRLRVKLLQLVQFLNEQVRPVQKVLKGQVLARHRLGTFRREPQHGEQLRPVRPLPSLAAAKFERGNSLFILLNLLQQHDRDGVLILAGSNLLVPLGEEIVKLVQLTADEDPIAPRELVLFLVEISDAAPRLARRLDVA